MGIPPATTGPTKRGGGLRGQEPVDGGGVQSQSQFSSRGTDGGGGATGRESMPADLHRGSPCTPRSSFCLPELSVP